jgi:hypothetical protein
MANIIKVRCNGPEKHLNEVDLDKVSGTDVVLRIAGASATKDLPERLVFLCRQCTAGKVIITRDMFNASK